MQSSKNKTLLATIRRQLMCCDSREYCKLTYRSHQSRYRTGQNRWIKQD